MFGDSPLRTQLVPRLSPSVTDRFVYRRSWPTVRRQIPSKTKVSPSGKPSIETSWPTLTAPPGEFGPLRPVWTVSGSIAVRSCPIVVSSRWRLSSPPDASRSWPTLVCERSASANSPRVTSPPTVTFDVSAPASVCTIRSRVIVAFVISQNPSCGTIRLRAVPENAFVSCGQTTSCGCGAAVAPSATASRDAASAAAATSVRFMVPPPVVWATIVRPAATGRLPTGYRPRVLEFRVLGPLEAAGERGPIRLGGPRQRATLAILLLHANRVVPSTGSPTTSTPGGRR